MEHSPRLYAQILLEHTGRNQETKKSKWRVANSLLLAIMLHAILLTQFAILPTPIKDPIQQEILQEVELITLEAVSPPSPKKQQHTINKPKIISTPTHKKVPFTQKLKHSKNIVPKPLNQLKSIPKIAKPKGSIAKTTMQNKNLQPPTLLKKYFEKSSKPSQNKLNIIRQQYLDRILHIIAVHKIYPYSARRRHIEGNTDLSFLIDSLGHIKNIQINGKSRVLRLASQNALNASRPFPVLPKNLTSPIKFHCIIQYQLSDE